MRVGARLGVVGAIAYLALGTAPALADTFAPNAAPEATLARLAHAVGGHNAAPDDPALAYLSRLDGHLQELALQQGDAQGVALAAAHEGVTLAATGGVAVDVYVHGDLAAAADAPARAGHAGARVERQHAASASSRGPCRPLR